MINIQVLAKKDVQKLAKLYKEVFEVDVDNSALRWQYFDNPKITSDKLYNVVATNADTIVGHTAFIPINYKYRDMNINGALSVGSMISSKQQGLFPQLYFELEKKMTKDGFDFLFAFPNENSYPFFIKMFGYKNMHFECLQINKNNLNLKYTFKNFPEEDGIIVNELGIDYMKWRLDPLSGNDYHETIIKGCSVVYRKYLDSEIDIVSIDTYNPNDFLSIVIKFINSIESENINIYSTNIKLTKSLLSIGFKSLKVRNKFVVKMLNNKIESSECILQMIDSDVF